MSSDGAIALWGVAWVIIALVLYFNGSDLWTWALIIGGLAVPVIILEHSS